MRRMKNKEILLFLGAVAGIVLAAVGSVSNESAKFPQGAIALINGTAISESQFLTKVAQLEKARNTELTDTQKQEILQSLINDQLVVERAAELGLAEQDAVLRAAIIDALKEFIISEKEGAVISEESLNAFYKSHISRYTPPAKYRLKAYEVAEAFGGSTITLENLKENSIEISIPDQALSAGLLRRFIGRDAAGNIPAMEVGEISGPYRKADKTLYVYLGAVELQDPRAFSDVKTLVAADYARVEGDKVFASYIQKLRQEANIVLAEGAE